MVREIAGLSLQLCPLFALLLHLLLSEVCYCILGTGDMVFMSHSYIYVYGLKTNSMRVQIPFGFRHFLWWFEQAFSLERYLTLTMSFVSSVHFPQKTVLTPRLNLNRQAHDNEAK